MADRANTLSIIASTVVLVMNRQFYNPTLDDFDSIIGMVQLFKQHRSSGLNSSVSELVLMDWSVIVDDTSISRDGGYEVKSGMGTQEFYHTEAMVLPPDNNPVSYELAVRPSGYQTKIIRVAAKADEMFGMIGGALLFMYFFAGLIARSYREYLQRIKIANIVYKNRKGNQLSYCD